MPRQRLTVFSFPVRNKRGKKKRKAAQRGMPTPFRQKRSLLSGKYANSDLRVGGWTAFRNKEALVMIDLAYPTMLSRLFEMNIAIVSLPLSSRDLWIVADFSIGWRSLRLSALNLIEKINEMLQILSFFLFASLYIYVYIRCVYVFVLHL